MEHPLLSPASSYDELWRQVDFATMDIPERFNLGVACADRQDPAARALTVIEVDRTSRDHTFGELTESSNRLANALAALGVGRGDVVGLVSPASFETGVGFVAMFRMGAIALPLSSMFGPDALRYRLRNAGAKAVVTAAANARPGARGARRRRRAGAAAGDRRRRARSPTRTRWPRRPRSSRPWTRPRRTRRS